MSERETPDPIAALKSKDIHTRAAGARDLSREGTPADIPLLVQLAREDRSPAVRLCTAGAAADILSRYRSGPRAAELSPETREELFTLFRGIDPAINAGLFSMLACIELPKAIERLAAGLRDPRGGVRVGAAIGLQRLAASMAHAFDPDLEARIITLLGDDRLPPDALAEVARVSAAVGYQGAATAMGRIDLPGAAGDVVTDAIATLDRISGAITGAWYSDGRDVGEVNPSPSHPPALLVVTEAGGAVIEEGGRFRILKKLGQHRRMFVRKVGEDKPGRVLQTPGRTWYKGGDDQVMEAIGRALDGFTLPWGAAEPLGPEWVSVAEAIVPGLPEEGTVGRIAAAMLHAAAGQPAQARADLEAAVGQKKCPAEAWFFLGEALAAAGEEAAARGAWETAIKRAKKKDPVVERAQARLDG